MSCIASTSARSAEMPVGREPSRPVLVLLLATEARGALLNDFPASPGKDRRVEGLASQASEYARGVRPAGRRLARPAPMVWVPRPRLLSRNRMAARPPLPPVCAGLLLLSARGMRR